MSAPPIVALHGHDDDPSTFEGRLEPLLAAIADHLGGRAADLSVVVPGGLVATPAGGRAWWGDGPDGVPDAGSVVRAVRHLDTLLRAPELAGRGRPVVVGWSQGAALALAHLLDVTAAPVAAVVAVAGWLPDDEGLSLVPAAAAGVPVLVGVAADDDVVPPAASRSAGRVLDRAGARVIVDEQPGGHRLEPFLVEAGRFVGAAVAPG